MDIGKIAAELLAELKENKAHAEGMIEGVSELVRRIREGVEHERSSGVEGSVPGGTSEEKKPAST